MAMEDMVVVAVLVLIISVVAVMHMDVMYDLKMKMRFMMSMRRDLMIMKILLVTMGVLDSHMNIVVVLVLKGKIIVVVAIEMIRIALLMLQTLRQGSKSVDDYFKEMELLLEYEDVFPDEVPPGLPPKRGIKHQIDLVTGASLPNHAAYRTNPEETKEIQRQVEELMRKGYVQERQGVEADEEKIKAVRDWAPAQNVNQVRSFLGLASFYRRFVKDFSMIAAPINELTKKEVLFKWGEAQQKAFEELKMKLTTAPVLALQDFASTMACVKNVGSGPGDEDLRPLPCLPTDVKGKATKKRKYADADTERATAVVATVEYAERGCARIGVVIVDQLSPAQRAKPDHAKYPGLLSPLPVPAESWQVISMDFIEGLPRSGAANCVMVVVDKFIKFAHFMPLLHPFSAQQVAQVFLNNIYRLHGMPTHIISDRDLIFTSHFWKELFRLAGTQLCMSSTYHPQSDGQTERVNQCLEVFLRCSVHSYPKQWLRWLNLAEYWYNTSLHSSLNQSPFEVLYGHPPRHFGLSPPEASSVPNVETMLTERSTMLDLVLEKIGAVAYKLDLPASSSVHPVFHVSLLKVAPLTKYSISVDPPESVEGLQVPEAVLQRRLHPHRTGAVVQFLIKWSGLDAELAT
ncbi:uncharacterized protein [Miscanthus floridulus]|uniref:uncharacterized protein n=1 Tax=Miscanthus floridulus TaxID=154761 RepID=UPI00345ADBA1